MLSILKKEKKIIFKFLLVLIYLILSNQNIYQTLFIDIGHNSTGKMFFYILASMIFFIFFFYASFNKNTIYRIILCLPFLISSFFSQLYYQITNQIINIDVIEIALISKGSYINFINQYSNEIIINLIYFIIGLIAISLASTRIKLFSKKRPFFIFFFLYFLFIFLFSILKGGFGQHGLPSQLKSLIPFILVNFTQNLKLNDEIRYEKNYIQNKSKILIIDESIGFNYFKKSLLLDNLKIVKNKSFFKDTRKFHSLHNCSAQSVWALFNGLTQLNDEYYIRKNLWKIAKLNNYKTLYFSAQEQRGSYQYMQKPDELMYIDSKFFYGSLNNKLRDLKILGDLKKHITSEDDQFIVILKNGSHFPYSSQFDYNKYKLKKILRLKNYIYTVLKKTLLIS